MKYDYIDIKEDVIIRPRFMSICKADQRYYLGQRDQEVLKNKLPMALIHECCGEVIYDKTGEYNTGEMVVMIPNIPGSLRNGEYENYSKGAKFLSSGYDGFMCEFVSMPRDRIVKAQGIRPQVAAICEFVSVGVHAVNRFNLCAHEYKNTIAVWGDGSLSYIISCILKNTFKDSKIVVIGKNRTKLSYFSFADETYMIDEIPKGFAIDHAFECVGSSGSYYAINDMIKYINPQGAIVLMGVSEDKIAINTRDILEKGLTVIGCSRSGKEDFKKAIELMKDQDFERRLSAIICEKEPVKSVDDIHRVFAEDISTLFKTVFEWKM